MKFTSLLLLLLGVLSSCYAGGLQDIPDYRSTGSCDGSKPLNCTSGGLFCESCTSLVLCTNNGQIWEKSPVATCTYPQKCVKGQCSDGADPICDGRACLPFICHSVGIYPDPFFCNKYVLCVDVGTTTRPSLKGYLNDCDEGFGYNIATSSCDVALAGGKCGDSYPVPECTKPGDTGPLPQNPSIYYICKEYSTSNKVLYPVLERCPNGDVYENFSCQPNSPTTVGSNI